VQTESRNAPKTTTANCEEHTAPNALWRTYQSCVDSEGTDSVHNIVVNGNG